MRKPAPLDFSFWTTKDLVVYGVGCADALDTTTAPAMRKRFHAINAAILKELGTRLMPGAGLLTLPRRVS